MRRLSRRDGKETIREQAKWHALKCEAVRWRWQKKPLQAIECLAQAIELTRQSPDLARETGAMLNYLADVHFQEGHLDKAEAVIRRALQTNLGFPDTECSLAADDFILLAKILSKQQRHQEAYDAGSQALALFRRYRRGHDKFVAQIEEVVKELGRQKECLPVESLVVPANGIE